MQWYRKAFRRSGCSLSFLDTHEPGHRNAPEDPVLLCLHGHFMESVTWADIARRLHPAWRVIALDQRGHGHSDHPESYTQEDYVADVVGLLDRMHLPHVAILGHSLGGAVGVRVAAEHADRVVALVVEDLGAVVDGDNEWALEASGHFPSRTALLDALPGAMRAHVADSVRHTRSGWHLAFDPVGMVRSQLRLNGEHWEHWRALRCPTLLVHGTESTVLSGEHATETAAANPVVRLETLTAGHVVHTEARAEFATLVTDFLAEQTWPVLSAAPPTADPVSVASQG